MGVDKGNVCEAGYIYSAEQVIGIWAAYDSVDKRPQDAIQTAKDYLSGRASADAAANAAAYAANAAAEKSKLKHRVHLYALRLARGDV